MAFETLRGNKMRSALTVLGVVIGVTSIVGMTSLIRGFDTSLRDSIAALGPNTIFVQRFGAVSFSSGASFLELMRRPEPDGGRRARPSSGWRHRSAIVDIWLGAGPPQPTMERMFYRGERTRPVGGHGHHRALRRGELRQAAGRARRSPSRKCCAAGAVAVIGYGPYDALFEARGIDPIGKSIRIGAIDYTVLGVIDKRPAAGGFSLGQDDFAIIPYTAFRKQFGNERVRRGPFGGQAGDDRGGAARRRLARGRDAARSRR